MLAERTYFSIGGGFVRDEDEIAQNAPPERALPVPYPFATGAELLEQAQKAGLSIAGLMAANELALHTEAEIAARLDEIADAMYACIERGMRAEGVLPGGLNVARRANKVWNSLVTDADKRLADPLAALDWVNLWALAVNEENAAGGRVVTAPTNGAAGLLPAVLRYYDRFHQGTAGGRHTFLLTAAAIAEAGSRAAADDATAQFALVLCAVAAATTLPLTLRPRAAALAVTSGCLLSVLAFETFSPRRMAPAVERWLTAINEGTHTHDGDDTTTPTQVTVRVLTAPGTYTVGNTLAGRRYIQKPAVGQ